MSIFGVILVRVCPAFSHIWNLFPYSFLMRENAGQIWVRITPNTETFYAVQDSDAELLLFKSFPYSELFWSAFVPHFPTFGLNTERCGVSLRIHSECEKNTGQNNSEYGHFLHSARL